jgi:hypothetical protein
LPEEKSKNLMLAIQKSLDTPRYAEMIDAATRASEKLRLVYETPGIQKMLERVTRNETAMRLWGGTGSETRHGSASALLPLQAQAVIGGVGQCRPALKSVLPHFRCKFNLTPRCPMAELGLSAVRSQLARTSVA